jgi:hypothetical protein
MVFFRWEPNAFDEGGKGPLLIALHLFHGRQFPHFIPLVSLHAQLLTGLLQILVFGGVWILPSIT